MNGLLSSEERGVWDNMPSRFVRCHASVQNICISITMRPASENFRLQSRRYILTKDCPGLSSVWYSPTIVDGRLGC